MQKGHHCDNNNNNNKDNNNIMSLTNVFKLRAKTKVKFKTTTTTAATPTNNSTPPLLLLILQTILLMLTVMPTATMTTLTTATSGGGGGGGVLTEMASITAATTALRQQQRPQQLQQLLLVRTLALVARPVDEMAETDTHEAETKAQLHRGGSTNDANNFVTLRSRRRRNHNNNNMDIYDLLNANHLSAFPPSPASSSSWLTTSSFPASSQSSLTSSLSSSSSSFLPSSFSPSSPSSSPSATSSLLTQMMPVFDFGLPRNITARSGQTAAINCRVENLGDKSVSWIRKRDLHILTAGILTYTSDERFRVVRTDDSKTWSLHVKFAQPRDSGIYECQVNTEPKISMAFRLNVRVTPPDSKAIIDGPADLYAKVGSAITLNCRVNQPSSQDIGPIYWYRGPYALTPFVAHPNDAAIDLSRRISMESQLGDVLKSRLRIANAHTADSANYTCMPTTAEAASVMVHVIDDEHPAAMQKSSAARRLQFDGQHIISIIITFMPFSQLLHNLLSFQRTS